MKLHPRVQAIINRFIKAKPQDLWRVGFRQSTKTDGLPRGFSGAKFARKARLETLTLR